MVSRVMESVPPLQVYIVGGGGRVGEMEECKAMALITVQVSYIETIFVERHSIRSLAYKR